MTTTTDNKSKYQGFYLLDLHARSYPIIKEGKRITKAILWNKHNNARKLDKLSFRNTFYLSTSHFPHNCALQKQMKVELTND